MKLGIVGLPNVGKSTLFNAITNAGAAAANYAFCTIEPNVGMVAVPDARLDALAEMYHPKKLTPAVIEIVDIAGLVKGAAQGEGLGNKFLSHIREVDAIIHVVRCFDSDDILHVDGDIDPARDIETIDFELVLSDLEILQRRADKLAKLAKAGDKSAAMEIDFCAKLLEHLAAGKTARTYDLQTEAEKLSFAELPLLSGKPVIYAGNVSEDDLLAGLDKNPYYHVVQKVAKAENAGCLPICAKVEEDIIALPKEEQADFLQAYGLESSGLDSLIKQGYATLGLISFLTSGEDEVRAWTIQQGTKAPKAAGKIHSDLERGFIRAEIVAYDDLMQLGSMAAAKEKGLVRSEGKEYIMKDGDVTLVRFNV